MFRNPETFSFVNFTDTAISKAGRQVISNQTFLALAGNDAIIGRDGIVGIQIEGKLDTGSGNGKFSGIGAVAGGAGNYNNVNINIGTGDNIIDALED